jgi:hypothetical protein
MSDVTRESGYFVVVESAKIVASIDRLKTLKDVAHWLIDSCDFYPSQDMMSEMQEITESGGVASVELEDITATLTVAFSAPVDQEEA